MPLWHNQTNKGGAQTVSDRHSVSTCDAPAKAGKKAKSSSLSPLADKSRASPSIRKCSKKWLVECVIYKNGLPIPKGVKGPQTGEWLSHMLTWLVLTLEPFVRSMLGKHWHICQALLSDAVANSDVKC